MFCARCASAGHIFLAGRFTASSFGKRMVFMRVRLPQGCQSGCVVGVRSQTILKFEITCQGSDEGCTRQTGQQAEHHQHDDAPGNEALCARPPGVGVKRAGRNGLGLAQHIRHLFLVAFAGWGRRGARRGLGFGWFRVHFFLWNVRFRHGHCDAAITANSALFAGVGFQWAATSRAGECVLSQSGLLFLISIQANRARGKWLERVWV